MFRLFFLILSIVVNYSCFSQDEELTFGVHRPTDGPVVGIGQTINEKIDCSNVTVSDENVVRQIDSGDYESQSRAMGTAIQVCLRDFNDEEKNKYKEKEVSCDQKYSEEEFGPMAVGLSANCKYDLALEIFKSRSNSCMAIVDEQSAQNISLAKQLICPGISSPLISEESCLSGESQSIEKYTKVEGGKKINCSKIESSPNGEFSCGFIVNPEMNFASSKRFVSIYSCESLKLSYEKLYQEQGQQKFLSPESTRRSTSEYVRRLNFIKGLRR